MNTNILVTGGTGALGKNLLFQLKSMIKDVRVIVLTRNPEMVQFDKQVKGIFCDLTKSDFGNCYIADEVKNVNIVIHAAADVRWNQDLLGAMQRNATVTENFIEFVKKNCPKVKKFIHVSTAYSDAPGYCLNCGPYINENQRMFNNTYEYSKWYSEKHVVESGLPFVIIRPSLIVGDQKSGEIGRYNGIYHMLKSCAKGFLPFMVGNANALIDIVPVDVVSSSIINVIYERSADGRIVMVVSGSSAPFFQDIIDRSLSCINRYRMQVGNEPVLPPKLLSCDFYNRVIQPMVEGEVDVTKKKLMKALDVFHPYLTIEQPFIPPVNSLSWDVPNFDSYYHNVIERWCTDNPSFLHTKSYTWVSR